MVEQQRPYISREQMGHVVRNKKQFYNAMKQMHFVMPDFKQSIISIKFMHKVRSDQIWMPLAPDVKACRSVAYPPTNAMLIDFIARAVPNLQNLGYTEEHIVAIKKLIKKVKKKGANKEWLLKVLYIFDKDCEVFDKSYRYVRPTNKINPNNLQIFNNNDRFFDDLPPLLPSELRRRQMRLSK